MKKIQSYVPLLVQQIARSLGIQGDIPADLDGSIQLTAQAVDLTDHQFLWSGLIGTFAAGGTTPTIALQNSAAMLRAKTGIGPTSKLVRIRRIYLSLAEDVGGVIAWEASPINEAVPALLNSSPAPATTRDGRNTGESVMRFDVGTGFLGANGPRVVMRNFGGPAIIDLNITIPSGGYFIVANQNDETPFAIGIEWDERDPTKQEMLNVIR